MKKRKLSASISILTGIIMLCTAVFVPISVTASGPDVALYDENYQSTESGVLTSENARVSLKVKNESVASGFSSFDSANKYLEAGYIGSGYIKAFSLIEKSAFSANNLEAPLTLNDVSVTGQSFRFNLSQMTRSNASGAYGLVYCYWYKNDKSYQQIVIGRKSATQMGVWIQHDYEGYENYYTAANTPYVCSERTTTKESKEILTGSTIDITDSGNQWFTCTIKFTSATGVTVSIIRDGDVTPYTDSFEDYTLRSWLYQNSNGSGIVNNGAAQQSVFVGGLSQEDLRKTKGIGIGVASNIASGAIAAVDNISVVVDADTYAAELQIANDNITAATTISQFKTKYAEQLALSATSYEALYALDVSTFRLNASKIASALREYNAFSEYVKNGLSNEYTALNALLTVADKYIYSYGENYTQNFNDGVTAGNWTVVNKEDVLAHATEIGHAGTYNTASFITSADTTKGYSPAHIRSWITYDDMALRLISVLNDVSPEVRGKYEFSSVNFDTIAQSGRIGSNYIYWYKDKNNYKWFTLSTNGYWLSLYSGAVIDGFTVTTKSVDLKSYDGAALTSAAGNFNTNGSPINITVTYKNDGAYCSVSFVKDEVTYKTVAAALDGTYSITNGVDNYTSYSELEAVNSSLAGIGKNTGGGFGILSDPWYGARNYIDNLKIVYDLPYFISMEKGAYLKNTMPSGIKFGTVVTANTNYRGSDNIELISGGVLFMPTDKIANGELLTYEMTTVANANGAKALAAEKDFTSTTTAPSKIMGSLCGVVTTANYPSREFTSRGYVKYRFIDDAQGVYRIMYADGNSVSRSIYYVAVMCANDVLGTSYNVVTDGAAALADLIAHDYIADAK